MGDKSDYIRLHRSILTWEWFDDPNVFRVWIYILLQANWKDYEYHGTVYPRGSFLTTYSELSSKLKLSEKQVRNCIEKLCKTGEIVKNRAHNKMLIFVEKYDVFQVWGIPERAGKGQAKGTLSKEKEKDEKERSKEKEEIETRKEKEIKETLQRKGRFTPPSVDEVEDFIFENSFHFEAGEFWNYYQANGWMIGKVKMADWKSACVLWEQKRNPYFQLLD